jgi:hypothetical protein
MTHAVSGCHVLGTASLLNWIPEQILPELQMGINNGNFHFSPKIPQLKPMEINGHNLFFAGLSMV